MWTTGFSVHTIAQASTLEVGDAAWAIGPGGKPPRMACASGTPSAWQAADAIAARLTGTQRKDVPLRYFNQRISLGRREGLIQFVTADDRALPRAPTGRLAALCKEPICKSAVWRVAQPTLGLPTRRRPVVEQRDPTPVQAAV